MHQESHFGELKGKKVVSKRKMEEMIDAFNKEKMDIDKKLRKCRNLAQDIAMARYYLRIQLFD